MSINAGARITAAHLSHATKGVVLTNSSLTATETFTAWGTEYLAFTNPGISVQISAFVCGRLSNDVDANVNGAARVLISLDGGSTWTDGGSPFIRIGTSVGSWGGITAAHTAEGLPTGEVRVKVEFRGSDTDVKADNGRLTAWMLPA